MEQIKKIIVENQIPKSFSKFKNSKKIRVDNLGEEIEKEIQKRSMKKKKKVILLQII